MDKVYYISFLIFQFLVKNTPDFILNPFLNSLSFLAYLIDKRHKKIAKVNLDFAFGDELSEERKKEIIKRCYKNLVYNLADFVKNQGISKEKLKEKVKIENENYLRDALKEGKKVILITAHYGNWELAALTTGALFGPLTIVGRKLDSPTMNRILRKNREQFDIEALDKRGAMKGLIRALKEGRMVGLLVDQNTAEDEGILVDFFGKKARHTPSAALLARKFDALIVPLFVKTDDFKNFTLTFHPPIKTPKTKDQKNDIFVSTQKQAEVTEKAIREKPEEWFWFHRRWKNRYEHIYS